MVKQYCDKCGREAWLSSYAPYPNPNVFRQVYVDGDRYVVCEECAKQIQNLFRFRIENEEKL